MKKYLRLDIILSLTALLIASCAAYFSILGIGMLFSGAMYSAMFMAGTLEVGKLVATSFLYKQWKRVSFFLKTYLIIAIVILMFITSLGIFGYLTSAFQKSSIEAKLNDDKITFISSKKGMESNKITVAYSTLDKLKNIRDQQESRLNSSLTNVLIARNPILLQELQNKTDEYIEQNKNEVNIQNELIMASINKLETYDNDISKIVLENSQKKDINTFKFVAEETGMPLPKVVKWFIFLIILVFDPLAVCLLIAYNSLLKSDDIETVEENTTPDTTPDTIVEHSDSETSSSVATPQESRKKSLRGKGYGRFSF